MAATHAHRIARLEKGLTEVKSSLSDLASTNARILALLEDTAPATVTTKSSPAKKAPAKARKTKVTKAPAKGAQTRETLSRKDWNRTLTTLAKTQPKGSGAYKAVLDAWGEMSEARDAGLTPREALALLGF